jgi:glycine/D-amino acid oxidase-like deaminating enzyme/nitrite reductase/ring-hydroxylating ferredoxin subunit
MEAWVREYSLDCDFHRQPWYLYSASARHNETIEQEHTYAQEADVPVQWAGQQELPLTITKALKVPGQAQINPMRYVQELANAATSDHCQIFENTRVTDIEEEDGRVLLQTTGGRVSARYAIHATHIPKGVMAVQTALSMYREYGVAFRADQNDFPPGIFWGYHEDGHKYSSRLYTREDKKYVMVIGQPHRVGQADDNMAHIRNLEAFAKKHYGLQNPEFRWGGQHYKPADLLPYIGQKSSGSNIFIATGFSTDGLVYGTLAAMIIADAINDVENPWSHLYNAHRFSPLKSAKNLIEEGINTAKQYLRNLPGNTDESNYGHVKNGEGAIVESDGKKVAAYRDEQGKLTLLSAVCPHLKCIVNWNNAEKTWDCPCHASRFQTDGTVLEGPAYNPLATIERSHMSKG